MSNGSLEPLISTMLSAFTSEHRGVQYTDLNIPYSLLADVYFAAYEVIYEQLVFLGVAFFIHSIGINLVALEQKTRLLSMCKISLNLIFSLTAPSTSV